MTKPLPYVDYVLAQLAKRNRGIEKSFGRHMHWGYWEHPETAICDDADYGRAAEQMTIELCGLAGITDGQQILDAGCGFGGTVASLNERFKQLQLTGLNIDERQLERARQIVQPAGDNTVEFIQGDACELPFPDASFDRLLAVECIFHFPSRAAFFNEAYRVLRPGGVMALSDFVPSSFFLPVTSIRTPRSLEKYNVFGSYHLNCTIGKYRTLAKEAGLVPVVERDVTFNTLPTYRYLGNLVTRNASKGRAKAAKYLIGVQKWVASRGLLNYYLLSFRKP